MLHYPNTQSVDVEAYHENIKTALAELFPEMKTLGYYERIDDLPAVPALIFGLTEITPEADTGTEQVAVAFHWDAYFLADAVDDAHSRKTAFALASRLLAFLKPGTRFGVPVDSPSVEGAFPETISFGGENAGGWNNASAVTCVRVSWTQRGFLGENVHEDCPEGTPIFKEGIGKESQN